MRIEGVGAAGKGAINERRNKMMTMKNQADYW
jgi:hypothetical protein